jgi:hypothetical protein
MSSLELSFKIPRKCYHNIDLSQVLKAIDHEKEIRLTKRSSPFKPVLIRYPMFRLSTIQGYYNLWVAQDRPQPYIIQDHRKSNSRKKALPDSVEEQIKKDILNSYENDQIVSYLNVSNMALIEWEKLDPKPFKKFTACNGWVSMFMERNGLSSLAVSKRFSSRNHKKIEDCQEEVDQYKKTYQDFAKDHGSDQIVNFDQTSFGSMMSQVRTIAPKNCKNQPKMEQCLSGRGLSIGLSITASGQKLKSILVADGRTHQSLEKFGQYQTDPRCILKKTSKGWFTHFEMLMVLDIINDHMKGKRSLCIWDQYRAHLTKDVMDRAEQYNIQILKVPKGLTAQLQPLDFKVNGSYKSKMKSHWIQNNYNEKKNKDNRYIHLCETVLKCYDDLNQNLIKNSFCCLN